MAQASVKGTLIGAVIENLIRLRDAGRVADEELELRLEAEESALLGSKINGIYGLIFPTNTPVVASLGSGFIAAVLSATWHCCW